MNDENPNDGAPEPPLAPNLFDEGCARSGCLVVGTMAGLCVLAAMLKGTAGWFFDPAHPGRAFAAIVLVALGVGAWMWRRG